MDNLTPLQQFYYRLIGYIYYWTYFSSTRRFLGVTISHYVKWLPALALLVGWINGWPRFILYLLLGLIIFLRLLYWRSYQVSYNTFVPDKVVSQSMNQLNTEALMSLAPNQRVHIQATGFFSLKDREIFSLLRPAQYWHVPLGEHVVMVEHLPGRYLYQFFNGEGLQRIEKGWLIFGPQPQEALAVTFLTEWGPAFAENNTIYNMMNGGEPLPPVQRRIFFSFPDHKTQQTVWHNLIADARRVRE